MIFRQQHDLVGRNADHGKVQIFFTRSINDPSGFGKKYVGTRGQCLENQTSSSGVTGNVPLKATIIIIYIKHSSNINVD